MLATAAPRTRFGGLDGLRAIAVALVLVYHLFPTLLPGGFIGVDTFFTISGFLITSLLLRELELNSNIRLVDFWRRRARRLLPALGLMLLVTTALALLGDRDLLVGITSQLVGTTFFVSNWVFIANGANYFTRDTPELLRNTWSLSIEEQFYIILPIILLLLFRIRRRSTRVIPLLTVGLLSAWLMYEQSLSGAEATRVYFGSDTHVFGLLLGASLAIACHRPQTLKPSRPKPLLIREIMWAFIAVAGLATLVVLAVGLAEGSDNSFRGGLQLATIASLVTVWAVTREKVWISRVLDAQPLRWLGERSYGIYLWHWPLLLIIGSTHMRLGTAAPWLTSVLTLAVTLVVSALSHRYVEQPVRRLGLTASLRLLLRPSTPRKRVVASALALILLITTPATVYAIATAPHMSSAAEAIARGQKLLDTQQGAGTGQLQPDAEGDDNTASPPNKTSDDPDTQAPGSHTVESHPKHADDHSSKEGATRQAEDARQKRNSKSTPPDASDGKKSAASTHTTPSPPPPLTPEGGDISAVGDSVMLASLPELSATFPNISVDAAVSRSLSAGVGICAELASQGNLRRVLVLGLGTNGPIRLEDLDAIREIAGSRPIVLVNAYGERDWIPPVNQMLADYAAAHRGVVVADWAGSVTGVENALAGDGIHPNPSGGEIYAQAVRTALAQLLNGDEVIGFGTPRR